MFDISWFHIILYFFYTFGTGKKKIHPILCNKSFAHKTIEQRAPSNFQHILYQIKKKNKIK